MYKANDDRYSTMEYAHSGKSGLKLPKISFGLWHNFGDTNDKDVAKQMIYSAFDAGITYFDLANNYGNPAGSAERNFGEILSSDLKPYRDQLVVSSKAGYDMWAGPYGNYGSRKYLLSSLDQSLQRLQLDYVDIFYHHRMDPDTPVEESMMALDQAVKSGKALYAGISNYDSQKTKEAVSIMRDLRCPFIVNQVRYSLLDRHIERDNLLETVDQTGLGIVAFSPLAQGLLSDRHFNSSTANARPKVDNRSLGMYNVTPALIEEVKKLNAIAFERGQTLPQMALSWLLAKKQVTTVLVGSSKKEQLLDNLKCLENTYFTAEELTAIDNISLPICH
ncbi:MAG: aldo/keto reductase [Bacillota bacterium]